MDQNEYSCMSSLRLKSKNYYYSRVVNHGSPTVVYAKAINSYS
jgi:hypothetical protein